MTAGGGGGEGSCICRPDKHASAIAPLPSTRMGAFIIVFKFSKTSNPTQAPGHRASYIMHTQKPRGGFAVELTAKPWLQWYREVLMHDEPSARTILPDHCVPPIDFDRLPGFLFARQVESHRSPRNA